MENKDILKLCEKHGLNIINVKKAEEQYYEISCNIH